MHDLQPAVGELARLLDGISDDQLTAATPCSEYSVAALLEHVDGLSLAFTWAATKDPRAFSGGAPAADASRLAGDWRERIPRQLDALVAAWREADAWQGMTKAGGVDLPGEIAGNVATNELVVHGWDVARATGQQYQPDPQSLAACLSFVSMAAQNPGDGPFGTPVPVPDDAPELDRLVGLTGRDPAWSAS